MLFMGEEWAAAQPFPFFCDFGPELAEPCARDGARSSPAFRNSRTRQSATRIPDPTAEATFASAKLGWDDTKGGTHAGWLDWYRRVLGIRHAEIVPRLAEIRAGGRYELIGDGAVIVRWDVAPVEARC